MTHCPTEPALSQTEHSVGCHLLNIEKGRKANRRMCQSDMDSVPLREASEVCWENASGSEQNFSLKSPYSKTFFPVQKPQYCMSLLLAFVLGAILTAALTAVQKIPETGCHGPQPVADTVPRMSFPILNYKQFAKPHGPNSDGPVLTGWED